MCKPILAIVMLALVMTAVSCGQSGVSQDDYDAMTAETEAAKTQGASLRSEVEELQQPIARLETATGEEGPEAGRADGAVETPREIHQRAWRQAATNSGSNYYYKYSIYSARSLAVSNPEVYLQADKLWMDMISEYGGWGLNYLARDRELTRAAGWWEEIGEPVNDGFMSGDMSGSFQWSDFNWEEHRRNAVDLFDFYDDADTLDWLDNRLPFIWNSMKGLSWKMPYTSLAEALYMKLLSDGKQAYLLLTEDRRGYVAEWSGSTVKLLDPQTGDTVERPVGRPVLVMNNQHVWYPLMGRDDRARDGGLRAVVNNYCQEDARPELSEFEESIVNDLRDGTMLVTDEEFSWAKLMAIRAVNQNTWRSKPLRELSADVFPERYREDSGYSDSPYELLGLGMVMTEMGNRLSPAAAGWAPIVQEYTFEPRTAFTKLGGLYWERFHRTDSDWDWVYGDYYRSWLPTLDDKLISGLGDCFVEATSAAAVLSLANPDGWEIYVTNWWTVGEGGGDVRSGAYTPFGNYSLNNGLFRIRDSSVLDGPLWDVRGKIAYVMVYAPGKGFIVTTQTKNAASFSAYVTPFTNLDFAGTVDFLEHIKTLEEQTSIVVGAFPTIASSIDEYVERISQHSDQWESNMAPWPFGD